MGSSSARTDAVDGDDGRVHQTQLLVLINAQLIAAASSTLQRGHLGIRLGARWQEEAHAPCYQHVPDAVDVEVVLLRLHKGVKGHGRRGNHGAREEEEHPALPGGWIATAPTDGSHRLTGQQTHNTMLQHLDTFIMKYKIENGKSWEHSQNGIVSQEVSWMCNLSMVRYHVHRVHLMNTHK